MKRRRWLSTCLAGLQAMLAAACVTGGGGSAGYFAAPPPLPPLPDGVEWRIFSCTTGQRGRSASPARLSLTKPVAVTAAGHKSLQDFSPAMRAGLMWFDQGGARARAGLKPVLAQSSLIVAPAPAPRGQPLAARHLVVGLDLQVSLVPDADGAATGREPEQIRLIAGFARPADRGARAKVRAANPGALLASLAALGGQTPEMIAQRALSGFEPSDGVLFRWRKAGTPESVGKVTCQDDGASRPVYVADDGP